MDDSTYQPAIQKKVRKRLLLDLIKLLTKLQNINEGDKNSKNRNKQHLEVSHILNDFDMNIYT